MCGFVAVVCVGFSAHLLSCLDCSPIDIYVCEESVKDDHHKTIQLKLTGKVHKV